MKKLYISLIAISFSTIALSQDFTEPLTVETNDDAVLSFNNTDNSWQYLQFKRSGIRKIWMGLSNGNDFRINKEGGGNILLTGGNVGIGTTSPETELHLVGQFRGIQNNSGNIIGLYLSNDNTTNNNSNSIYFGSKDTSGDRDNGAIIKTIFSNHSSTGVTGNLVFETANNADNPSERLRITGTGNIGIGTSSPAAKLQIINQAQSSSGNTLVLGSTSNGSANLRLGYSTDYSWIQSHGSKPLRINELGNNTILNLNSGNVGIGTTSIGSHKLAVEGSIGAREIKVEASGWSDFVFENDYDLRTLEEVEEHINENGHLPEIPSEAEVTENGINLGEMDAKLLQKIEELTLYMIDMNKRMNQLETENQELKEKVNSLENK